MNLNEYHDKVWLPFSYRLDEAIKPYKSLRMLKRLFDIHFTLLGVLGIFATPKGDVDCYWYCCKRAKITRYNGYSFKKRMKLIKELFHQVWTA